MGWRCDVVPCVQATELNEGRTIFRLVAHGKDDNRDPSFLQGLDLVLNDGQVAKFNQRLWLCERQRSEARAKAAY